MKKTFYLKSIFLLICTLLAGSVSAQLGPDLEKYDHHWVKITDLSQVESGETVLLVDANKGLALPNESGGGGYIWGADVTINEDGTIPDDVPDRIKWTLTKDDYGYFTFKNEYGFTLGVVEDLKAVIGDTNALTTSFQFNEYGEDGGYLAYIFNYLGWDANNHAVFGSGSKITLYKRAIKNYVKWKRVDGNDITLSNKDVVVIVDLTTGRAMSNDKADKDPDAVAITLNDDKDRIVMDSVPEKVQWQCNKTSILGSTIVSFKTNDGQNLYADKSDKSLKVGNTDDSNNQVTDFVFSINDYLIAGIDGTNYRCYAEESMFSNCWKLGESDDDDAKKTKVAIFKKIDNPQKVVKLKLAEYYDAKLGEDDNELYLHVEYSGTEFNEIDWESDKTDVATVEAGINAAWKDDGVVTLKKRGTAVITASVDATIYHDKASAKCTVIIDDFDSEEPGSINNPLTVAQAKELAEKGKVTINNKEIKRVEGVNYYIKGKVSKVNSGMMAMFGDMDFGEMMGNIGGSGAGSGLGDMNFDDMMDDMDFDMDDMEDSGFDMSSMGFDMSSMGFDLSAFFGSSDKVTYYISDDGTKDGQLKVLNGCGEFDCITNNVTTYQKMPKLSPGDCVIVRGPLVETEDTNMFAGLMSNGDDEPKKSWKVGELNYLFEYDPTLLVEDTVVYVNKTLNSDGLFEIDNIFDCSDIDLEETKITSGMQEPTFKSSDEEIAKWDADSKTIIGVKEGKAKITVKRKVIVVEDNPNTDDNEEKSYTMKRKFKLNVLSRDLDPAGKYAGDYVLTTNTSDLEDGTRLILVGTRVKDDKETDYVMVENNAMMGGGKNGSKITIEDPTKELIPCEDVPQGTFEIVLEQDENDANTWYLNVGKDENDNDLYLYASDTSEEDGQEDGQEEGQDENKFDVNKFMEMFSPSSGLKVGTKDEVGLDSLKATIAFDGNIATIKYTATEGKNNTIMLSSSFDMEEMMNMFGEMGNKDENEGNEGNEGNESSSSSFDMGSFDMFMAAFNTKKPGDEKSFMPRIYRFVPDPTFDISIGATEWRTIVTYKNVEIPENVEAYVVTKVNKGEDGSSAILKEVEDRQLKGGEPYLLHRTSGRENYTLTVLDPEVEVDAPETNLLQVSNKLTVGEHDNTSVYVLAKKTAGVGFYRWAGGILGSGRVYLPVEASVGANDYCGFAVEQPQTTAIQSIDNTETNVGPFYDLQGRRVNQLQQKGIYINNGKKVVVK